MEAQATRDSWDGHLPFKQGNGDRNPGVVLLGGSQPLSGLGVVQR